MRRLGDRFGIGWRPELAASIFANLDHIDLVEVIADDWFDASPRPLRTLAQSVPVMLHATSLGLASAHAVDEKRLAKLARVVDAAQPELWSEHLAFVRADGVEIGHLAAPPRTAATIDGLVRNVARARAVVGSKPALENIATLIEPPASTMSEAAWVSEALRAAGTPLLLDLHNLHANASNFGFDAHELFDATDALPIACVHVAGGRRVRGNRILDDHLHPTPDAVFALLRELASRRSEPLTVVLERDGNYPQFGELLAELDNARAAVAEGRADARSRELPRAAVR